MTVTRTGWIGTPRTVLSASGGFQLLDNFFGGFSVDYIATWLVDPPSPIAVPHELADIPWIEFADPGSGEWFITLTGTVIGASDFWLAKYDGDSNLIVEYFEADPEDLSVNLGPWEADYQLLFGFDNVDTPVDPPAVPDVDLTGLTWQITFVP